MVTNSERSLAMREGDSDEVEGPAARRGDHRRCGLSPDVSRFRSNRGGHEFHSRRNTRAKIRGFQPLRLAFARRPILPL
jgi:hypothetical protein